ncbi:hypothetical protein EMIT0P253_270022 [Pseudomonas sp. IT-P253]
MSSADLLPFVITSWEYSAHSHSPLLTESQTVQERLEPGEGLRQKNAANIRGFWGGGFSVGSSEGIYQRAEYFIGSLGDFYAGLNLKFALGHLDHIAGQVRLLAAINRTQAIHLGLGRLAGHRTFNRSVGDLASGLIDAVLPCLNSAQTGIKSAVS